MNDNQRPNRLINEKSPYLLQHAYNPVDWQPWDDAAFAQAEAEDKPIFLSIGYSTCHWCHVMEHESFEDPEVARLMNRAFVCIKVDREERPDIDNVYMAVCQAMTGSGGWPLTIIMTPDKRPFYAATYIPREARFGQMGMLEFIPRIEEFWRDRRADVLDTAGQVVAAMQSQERSGAGDASVLSEDLLDEAYGELKQRYDENRGGFGRAPKFPTPHNLSFLLRYWKRTGEASALQMVEKTLQAMHRGGIWDQLGFGLHRYSTDAKWLVPHFEKMLYDQALLALACLETYQATADERYAQMAREIFTYVLRDMTIPEGGFYSAEDADSEGVEGKFYEWTEVELREALPAQLADLVVSAYGVKPEGNFHDEATGEATIANILHLSGEVSPEAREQLEQARSLLLTAREKRVRPGLDDKILTDWNGLMIAALARGAQVLAEPAYHDAAARAAIFILKEMVNEHGRLLHRYRAGEAAILAYVDDFAFLCWALIELYETDFSPRWLREALRLSEYMLKHFWDDESGGLYFSAEDNEQLMVRPKEVYDGAVLSGNSVAMLNLLRLARLTGRSELEDRAAELGAVFAADLRRAPSMHAQMLCAVDYALGPAAEVVLAGDGEGLQQMLKALRSEFLPNTVVLQVAEGLADLAPFAASHAAKDGGATAYVCRQQACAPPTAEVAEMMRLLK
ncbi:MAG: thioredoxin domain-containing protein [Armatimonadota bacterium]